MTFAKSLVPFTLCVAISACSTADQSPTEAQKPWTIGEILQGRDQNPGVQMIAPDYRVRNIEVTVPQTLRVSEANIYFPIADIVWRGDPYGDRYEQVKKIFEDGFALGAKQLTGKQAVDVRVTVRRFHSLTERTRYTIGGTHSITFMISVHDAKTGTELQKPREVKADLKGLGGEAAVQAEHAGQGQRVRIVDHLSRVIQEQLSKPLVFRPKPAEG